MLHYNILLSFGFLVYVVTIYHLLKLPFQKLRDNLAIDSSNDGFNG